VRSSWIYGPRASNFYQIIRSRAEAGEPMRMVDDQTSVPTPARFLALQTVKLLKKSAEGLLHVVPSGQATRFDFALEVAKGRSRVERASTAEFPGAAARPAYSVLDNRRAAALLGGALPGWRELLPV
jgi:dTDP-4-dehydrorhamnose reductase